ARAREACRRARVEGFPRAWHSRRNRSFENSSSRAPAKPHLETRAILRGGLHACAFAGEAAHALLEILKADAESRGTVARRDAVVAEDQVDPIAVARGLERKVERVASRRAAVLEAVLDQRLKQQRRHRGREQLAWASILEAQWILVALARDAEIVLDEADL